MTQLNRVRVALTGFQGGPGVATFYFLGLQTARQSLQTMWTDLAASMPDDVTVRVESTGDIIESTDGSLVGTWAKDPLPPIPGLSGASYSAPSGYMIRWLTGSIVGGKRVRGRTFVVPLASTAYGVNGQLAAIFPSQIEPVTNAFVFEQSLDFVIWSRPFAGSAATPTRAARPPRLGSHSLVKSSVVPIKVAVLRSRRD